MEQSLSPAQQLAAIRSKRISTDATTRATTTAASRTRNATFVRQPIPDVNEYPVPSGAGYPSLATYENGVLTELNITSSLMSQIIYKNNILEYCPKKLYETYLTANNQNPPTESMQKGLYFESILLGKGRSGSLFDLPRLKNGAKSIDQLRIEDQAKIGEMIFKMYGMEIIKKGKLCNVQVPVSMQASYDVYPDLKFNLNGALDILSPISVPKTDYNYPMAVIDVKLTMSRFNEHGEYCWGLPKYMDFTQGVLYSTITNLPFFYLVFDYKEKTGNGHKLLPVATMAMFPNGLERSEDEPFYNLAKQRQSDLRVNVKTVAEQILKCDSEGYPENPSYKNCDRCPVSKLYPGGTCEYVNFIQKT